MYKKYIRKQFLNHFLFDSLTSKLASKASLVVSEILIGVPSHKQHLKQSEMNTNDFILQRFIYTASILLLGGRKRMLLRATRVNLYLRLTVFPPY